MLRKWFDHKEIGWFEIGERFTRYIILKTRWFNVYLHELEAPNWAPTCHDHPWSFVTILIWNGYLEQVRDKFFRRRVGSILYRPAKFQHNVITPYGKSWSIVITTRKSRKWGYMRCGSNAVQP